MQAIQVHVYHFRVALLNSAVFPELNVHVERELFQSHNPLSLSGLRFLGGDLLPL